MKNFQKNRQNILLISYTEKNPPKKGPGEKWKRLTEKVEVFHLKPKKFGPSIFISSPVVSKMQTSVANIPL